MVLTLTRKIEKKWESIFQSGKSQGILNTLERAGLFSQNTGKIIILN